MTTEKSRHDLPAWLSSSSRRALGNEGPVRTGMNFADLAPDWLQSKWLFVLVVQSLLSSCLKQYDFLYL